MKAGITGDPLFIWHKSQCKVQPSVRDDKKIIKDIRRLAEVFEDLVDDAEDIDLDIRGKKRGI